MRLLIAAVAALSLTACGLEAGESPDVATNSAALETCGNTPTDFREPSWAALHPHNSSGVDVLAADAGTLDARGFSPKVIVQCRVVAGRVVCSP